MLAGGILYGIDDMMGPRGTFVCRASGADRVVPKVPAGVVLWAISCRPKGLSTTGIEG